MGLKWPKRSTDYLFLGFVAGVIAGFAMAYYYLIMA